MTEVYRHHILEHRLTISEADALGHAATMVRTVDQSKAIAGHQGPMVIIAGSGMATGGRVLHHLSHYAPDPRNAIALVGYQAAGTRGAALAVERERFVDLFDHPDQREGVNAFLEKRAPRWQSAQQSETLQ